MNKFALYLNAAVLAVFTTTASATLPWVDNFANLDNWPEVIYSGDEPVMPATEDGNLVLQLAVDTDRLGVNSIYNPDFNFYLQPITVSLLDVSLTANEGNNDDFAFGIIRDNTTNITNASNGSITVGYRQTNNANRIRIIYRDSVGSQSTDFIAPSSLPRHLGRADLIVTPDSATFRWYDTDMTLLGSETATFNSMSAQDWGSDFALSISALSSSATRDARLEVGSVTVIPEPGTYALLVGLLVGMICWMRRRSTSR